MIRAEGLRKVYRGGVVAVESLDLTVSAGEVFGLLGPNGAGKTTTVGMLTTRIRPTGGRALVGGIDVLQEPSHARRSIGAVSQTNTLDRALSVQENLEFHGRYFGMNWATARRSAKEVLTSFQLADRASAKVSSLSGGMAQRLMIARALMHRPAVLFLDEPTAGLDPQSRLALWKLIGELRESGQTVLLTTHSMEEADALCSRLAIMDHGRILALGSPALLKHEFGGARELWIELGPNAEKRAIDDLATRLMESLGKELADEPRVTERGLRVRLLGDQLASGVLATVGKVAPSMSAMSLSAPTLETVFLNLTGRELRE